MNKDEIRKLIGGYASGTLTAAEQQQLFEAALDDQELFDELQKEQPLRELLSDPVAREQLRRTATDSLPKPATSWFRRPWILALGASVAAASITIAFLAPWRDHPMLRTTAQHSIETARAVAPKATAPGPPTTAPAAPVNVPRRAPVSKKKDVGNEPDRSNRNFVVPRITSPASPPLSAKQTEADKEQRSSTEQVEVTAAAPPPPPPPLPAAQPTVAPSAPAGSPPARNQENAPVAQAKTAHPLAKSAQAFRATQTAGALSQIVAAPYSISRRLEDGTYNTVSVDTVFHPNDSIRVTIFSAEPGLTSVEEWHAGDSAWHPIATPSPTFGAITGGVRRIGIPLDLTVKQGERLRVHSGSASYDIVIRTEP